jgi:hypothetical protein
MAKHPKNQPSNSLFESVVKNALDFLDRSVSELRKRPKYSVINFCAGLELFLKARLMLEHWSLVVTKPETASLIKFKRGDFRSVTMDEAIYRLENVAAETLSKDEQTCFAAVREHRNKLVHFFHEQYVSSDLAAIETVVAEQCKAWFYLHKLLTGRWSTPFKPYAASIKTLDAKMHANRTFLKAKYATLVPDIAAQIGSGAEYALCFSCGFRSLQIEDQGSPLFEATCRVCAAQKRFLRVECPECHETIEVHDMGEADCPNEDFTTTVEWLIENYGPSEDPKEESALAYCTECVTGPSAIPFGQDLGYLCLSCLGSYESAEKCDWCGSLNVGLRELSYLNGCAICDGKFGSESFLRE